MVAIIPWGIEAIPHHKHSLFAAGDEIHARNRMETYEVDTAPDIAYELDQHLGMSNVIVHAAPHYVFQRQTPLMGEIV